MKRYIIIVFLALIPVFFSSCTKMKLKEVTHATSVVGAWELRKAQIGMIPTQAYSWGNGTILNFSDSTYEKYTNNDLAKRGHYTIIEDTSVAAEVGLVIPSGQFTHRIVYDNDFASRKTFIQISNNELTLLSGYFPFDGGSNMLYQRIQNNH